MITVNGVDLRDLGFVASGRPQLPRLGGERTHIQQIPGRYGGVRMGGQVGDDTLSVTGHISAPDHATLLERIDLLTRVLQGRSVIRLSDYPDREWIGYLQQGPSRAAAIGPAWITRAENVVLSWTVPDPTARSQAEIAQVPGALALGTAPSPLRVEVQNGGVAPITRVVVEAFPDLLRNPGFEEGGAYWTQDTGISYLSDPAGAHSGAGYLEVFQPSGQHLTDQLVQSTGGGIRYFSVSPGDRVEYGLWGQRVSGDGGVRARLEVVDENLANPNFVHSPSITVPEWTLSASAYTVPAGKAAIRFSCNISSGNTTGTTARFDDVYLRILRQGEPQRILEWNGSIAPGALWECDAELLQVLNDGANAIDGLTPASEFPVAEPDPLSGYGHVLVTIEGGGGHTSTVRYRRRWL